MIYVILFLLLCSSMYLLTSNINLGEIPKRLKKLTPAAIDAAIEKGFFNPKSPYKNKIKHIKAAELGVTEKIKLKIKEIITHQDTKWGYLTFTAVTLTLALIGLYLGAVKMNNFIAGIILSIAFATFPYWYSQYKITKFERDKDDKLLVVISNIQASYMRHNNFATAVKEVLPTIPEPLYKYFKLYVDEVYLFSSDGSPIEAMQKLSASIDSYFFQEYMQLAIQAELGETGLKFTMQSVPEDFSEYLELNNDFSFIVEEYNIDFLTRLLSIPIVIGFLKVVSNDFYNILVTHYIAKISVILLLLFYIAAVIIYKKYNKPIKLQL